MKKKNLAILIVVLLCVGIVVYTQIVKPNLDNRTISAVAPTTISYEPANLSFTYPSGQEGYSLIEPMVPTTTSSGLQKVYIIMDAQKYVNYEQEDTETPPTISIFVLENPEEPEEDETEVTDESPDRRTRLIAWAQDNPQFSSYALRTEEPEVAEVDGVKGIHYRADGLYQQSIYLLSYRGYTYVFVGQYDSPADDIHQIFNDLIDSTLLN